MNARARGEELLRRLEAGELRVAERAPDGAWSVHAWVKEEILALFREAPVVPMEDGAPGAFRDKAPLAPRRLGADPSVRVVPGGSAIRAGSHLGPGVVCMPPSYVNVGAFVGAGTMIDSHVLVGSCAQIGERVHLSAGATIGGVLEPVGGRPVIVEDDVLVGGGAGLYEGVLVRERAVIAAGVVLTRSTRVFDLASERELTAGPDAPLEIPAGSVVVPGTRPAPGAWARERGLALSCALIVKRRDAATDARTALEGALR